MNHGSSKDLKIQYTVDAFNLLLFFDIGSTGWIAAWICIIFSVAPFTGRRTSIVNHWLGQCRNSAQNFIFTYVKIIQHFSRIGIIYIQYRIDYFITSESFYVENRCKIKKSNSLKRMETKLCNQKLN